MRHTLWVCAFIALCGEVCSATVVRISTSAGPIDVNLFDSVTPLTVSNFLLYASSDRYDGTFIHRATTNFVQGGGYSYPSGNHIPVFPPILNESALSGNNLRGTIAMAHSSDPNSAQSEWFFNVTNNSAINPQQFTVFGQVANPASLAVMDAIAVAPKQNLGGIFTSVPVLDDEVILVSDVSVVPEPAWLASSASLILFKRKRRR